MIRRTAALAFVLALNTHAQPFDNTYPSEFTERATMLDVLRQRADLARPWMQTPSGVSLVAAFDTLPPRIRRWRWTTNAFGERTYTPQQYHELPAEERRPLNFSGIPELIYYAGWGTDAPFVDLRALDVALAGTKLAEPSNLAGARILLVDPGVITHAWLLARHGANVTIVSASQRFRAVYNAPSDRGAVRGTGDAPDGSVTIIDANWPAERHAGLDGPFDLILAINTLKGGSVNPTASQFRDRAPVEPSKPLGITQDRAAERIAQALAPGGRAVIYNWGLPPRPNNDPTPRGDVRPAIGPDAARRAGLTPIALASDASVFNRILGNRQQAAEIRRPLDREGLTAPQLAVVYAVYANNTPEN